jgi:hypothetical protein
LERNVKVAEVNHLSEPVFYWHHLRHLGRLIPHVLILAPYLFLLKTDRIHEKSLPQCDLAKEALCPAHTSAM